MNKGRDNRTHERADTYDSYLNLAFLLDSVNKLEPREKWIIPILESNVCKDLKNQLLTAIEDHAKTQKT